MLRQFLSCLGLFIRQVGLWEKRHTYSRALSGGMKRKLCIANALVASPNFILLDEVREREVNSYVA